MATPNRAKGLSAVIWLLFLALALRALLPSGYMLVPGETGTGMPVVVPCSGAGLLIGRHAAVREDHGARHGTPDQPSEHRPDQLCAFSGLAVPIIAGVPPTLAEPREAAVAFPAAALLAPATQAGLAAPPPAATGPPTLL